MSSQTSPMRYVEVPTFGGPEVLQISQKSIPVPQQGEVLIQVHAAGVNRADLAQRAGVYPGQSESKPLLGLEVAGVVMQAASDVTRFQPGNAVCSLVSGGGYAEYVTAPADQCLPIPEGVSMVEAACIPEVAMTVWSNIFMGTPPQPEQFFLVHGGTSGIGIFAIQLGKALGLRVLTTAGSTDKCREALALGAEVAVNYREEDFETILAQHVGSAGIQAILDMVGGPYTPKNIRLLGMDGKLAQIAFMGGDTVEVNLRDIMSRRAKISGSLLTKRSPDAKAAIAADLVKHVWPLYPQGAIKTIIQQTFSLEQAAEAHRVMEQGGHTGKFVLTVDV